MKLKVKVCGNTKIDNLKEVCLLSPDYVGFIFYDKSRRNVLTPGQVAKTANCKAKRVGVFVNASEQVIRGKVEEYKLDIIQLHGDETPEFTTKINAFMPVFKVFQIDNNFNFNILKHYISACYYFVFDTSSKQYGGSGKKFDWSILSRYNLEKPFILSGGISENDIENIKKINHPKMIGVDLNSRFEISPGIKNIATLSTFLTQLQHD